MKRLSFTFFEMLIVAVIMSLVAALVIPQISKMPRRLEVDSALTGIRQAVSETSARARVTGKPLKLVLDTEKAVFSVFPIENTLSATKSWEPPLKQSEETIAATAVAVAACDSYKLSSSIEWFPEDTGLDAFDEIAYAFFEDGQAAGRPLRFNIAGRRFQMDVDKMTGDPLIQEFE